MSNRAKGCYILSALVLGLTPLSASSQQTELPKGMQGAIEGLLGTTLEELQSATPDEREESKEKIRNRIRSKLPFDAEGLDEMSKEDARARVLEQVMKKMQPTGHQAAAVAPTPLPGAPRWRPPVSRRTPFADGSEPLPVMPDGFAAMPRRATEENLLLVISDTDSQRVLLNRMAGSEGETLDISSLPASPHAIVLEYVDPMTGEVRKRFRPVAAQ